MNQTLAPQGVRASQVQQELEMLDKAAEELSAGFSLSESRLVSITRDEPNAEGLSDVKEEKLVPLASAIRSIRYKIENCTYRINGFNHKCEL